MRKGSQCYIEGRIQTRKWQGQDGQDRYTTEIVASEMQMLGSRGSGGGGAPPSKQREEDSGSAWPGGGESGSAPAAPAAPASGPPDDFDDDIPF